MRRNRLNEAVTSTLVIVTLMTAVYFGPKAEIGNFLSRTRHIIGRIQIDWAEDTSNTAKTDSNIDYKDFSFGRRIVGITTAKNDMVGDIIYSEKGTLVGVISVVQGSKAEVKLLGDNSLEISATAGSSEGVVVTEQGSAKMILLSSVPAVGQKIISDGIDGIFPPGEFIGTVAAVIDKDNPLDGVFVRFNFDAARLTSVRTK